MRSFRIAAMSGLALASVALPAQACRIEGRFDPALVEHADAVVVGRVTGYELIRTADAWMGGYARFTVMVDEVLAGTPPRMLVVTWNNSTYPEPEGLDPGLQLIALRKGGAPGAADFTVLQGPCQPAFILPVEGEAARTARRLIERRK